MYRCFGRVLALAFGLIAGQLWAYGTVPVNKDEKYLWSATVSNAPASSLVGPYYDVASAKAAAEAAVIAQVGTNNMGCAVNRWSRKPNGWTGSDTEQKLNIVETSITTYGDACGKTTTTNLLYTENYGRVARGELVKNETCPSNAFLIGSQCQCAVGFKPSGGQCVPVDCPPGGSYSKSTQPDQLVPSKGNVCTGGCEASPHSYEEAADGKLYAQWPFVYTGQHCSGQTDTSGVDQKGDKGFEDPPQPCGSGLCPGSMNGQSMCVPCSKSTSTPSTTEKAPQPVGATEAGVDGVVGAQSKESSTSCTGTRCTTTTIYRGQDGGEVGRSTSDKPKENFCQENPGISICKIGSFGGGCTGGGGSFTCDGDAVQCAIAREQHKRACEWSWVEPELKAKGDTAMAGGDQPNGHPFKDAQQSEMSFASQIDTTNRLPGSCPGDEAISVGGHSFVIPWSRACGSFEMLGNVVVGFALLAAASIVFRG